MKLETRTQKLAYVGIFTALGVILGTISFPVGPTKVAPFQHFINVITGVLLGPWWASLTALFIGTLRMSLGVGTIFSIPGGIPGAFTVGLMYKIVKNDWAAFSEPLATVFIGGTLSSLLFGPLINIQKGVVWFWVAFAPSTLVGTTLGFLILKALRRMEVIE
ncbi:MULTISPECIES: energy coupling factor transporter S component ThiW [Thermococcus]|uniref:ThiW protein n=1 Tax=Thermococcus sibiricus (strain DSM 12597 / MM 739) TaxID=604354 RepID=C6A1N4_THESM|nr:MULTISPECIES: energy coupling factor transporter S component ThiW [Thermococcus]ACS89529.1 ThiW protein [Thermococcus sibiricus MM 739]KUK28916.1 MAG: ThiW protein [Thermococcus sp. 40_45]MBC7094751.1 energy coupling factor transporter S component ThiW [Thermococcus sp.]HII66501.1 energy coupling factor transporter S component ThiW [Thermococcaceae archaeon]